MQEASVGVDCVRRFALYLPPMHLPLYLPCISLCISLCISRSSPMQSPSVSPTACRCVASWCLYPTGGMAVTRVWSMSSSRCNLPVHLHHACNLFTYLHRACNLPTYLPPPCARTSSSSGAKWKAISAHCTSWERTWLRAMLTRRCK